MENIELNSNGNDTLNGTILDKFNEIFDNLVKNLSLPRIHELKKKWEQIFNNLYRSSKKTSPYDRPKIMIPIIIYKVLKKNGINVRRNDFIAKINFDQKEFNEAYKRVILQYPDYQKRDKKLVIRRKIVNVRSHFNFDHEFLTNSEKILQYFWPFIKHAKEEISSGLTCIFTMIQMDIISPSFNEICKFLGISMSSMNNRVKKLMIDTLKVEDFESLKKSSKLIKEIMIASETTFEIKKLPKESEDQITFIKEQIDRFDSLIENKAFLTLRKFRKNLSELVNFIEKHGLKRKL